MCGGSGRAFAGNFAALSSRRRSAAARIRLARPRHRAGFSARPAGGSALPDPGAAPVPRLRHGTGTAGSRQMSSAYSRIVRSLENLPMRAVLRIAIRAHFAGSRYAASTRACASL